MRTGNEIREIFNLKYNNINSGQAPGLSDFEISLFLTDAQRQIIDEYYTGFYTKKESLEQTERVRKALSSLIGDENLQVTEIVNSTLLDGLEGKVYSVSAEYIWRILSESCSYISEDKCINNKSVLIKPVKEDELYKILRNPFKGLDKYVFRLDMDSKITLISKYPIERYRVRLLRMPWPFIISSLKEDWEVIEGKKEPQFTKLENGVYVKIATTLDNYTENIIIDRAVELATMSYKENNLQTQIGLNQRNE